MRILITGAGGAAAVSVWKSLSAEHELHMADIDPLAAGLYLVPPDRRLIIPRGDTPELVPALYRACKERRIEALLPTVDAELAPVAAARDEFESIGVALPLSPVECLRICRDKQLLMEAVQGKVPIPDNEPLTEAVAARVDSFPRFAKPREGAGSRGVARIDSRADLDKQPKDGSVMLQEYLPGEEYSVDVYVRRDGRVVAAVPRERMKIDSGIAVASRTVNVPDVIAAAVRTAEIIGIRGIANVQFKRAADGVFKLLEVNPRFPGTLPLTGSGRHRHAQADGRRAGRPEAAGRIAAVQGADGRALLDRALSRSPRVGGVVPPALTWLIRHGQSASNAGLPTTGYGEVPLTALGHRQAREVADRVQRQPDLLIVSAFLRACATAEPILARWPLTRCETWPIQELTYLSPARCRGTTAETRRPWVEEYWRRCDPDYQDGPDAEVVPVLRDAAARLPPAPARARWRLRRRCRPWTILPRLSVRPKRRFRGHCGMDEGIQDGGNCPTDGKRRDHRTHR